METNPFFSVELETFPDVGYLSLKKVFIKRLRHNGACGLRSNVLLYCVEADVNFCSVKNFISLPKIRISFCIFEIQLMLMCEICINFRWT